MIKGLCHFDADQSVTSMKLIRDTRFNQETMNDFSFNTNFLGRDGFTWCWSNRSIYVNKDQDGPAGGVQDIRFVLWGITLIQQQNFLMKIFPELVSSSGAGTGSAGMVKTIHFNQGDNVIGFFLDGENAQQPIVLLLLSNSSMLLKMMRRNPLVMVVVIIMMYKNLQKG